MNPLDGVERDTRLEYNFFQYFIKVVPTRVRYLNGTLLNTNQFSVTQYERKQIVNGEKADGGGHVHTSIPGIFFNFDISPM